MAVTRFLEFLNSSVSPYHSVAQCRTTLLNADFAELTESEPWNITPGSSYFVTREGSSLIGFSVPQKIEALTTRVIGSHCDSPTLKIKPQPLIVREGYATLAVEVYGSPIFTSWLDRNLKYAGIVYYENVQGELHSKKVIGKSTLRIPQLAIHLNRGVNSEGQKLNPQNELNPILSLNTTLTSFESVLKEEADIKGTILSWDLGLYEDVPATRGGLSNELIFGGRQDNLYMVSASLDALIHAQDTSGALTCFAAFNHEEVGSGSRTGADSTFLDTVLERVYLSLGYTREAFLAALTSSAAISADGAHAVHPNLPEKHDQNLRPQLNRGPVIKVNANMRYTSTAESIAQFKQLCRKINITPQEFCSRNDIPCGSTIGTMLSKSLGIPTIDIGAGMLAMHSISETTGAHDYEQMVMLFTEFYRSI